MHYKLISISYTKPHLQDTIVLSPFDVVVISGDSLHIGHTTVVVPVNLISFLAFFANICDLADTVCNVFLSGCVAINYLLHKVVHFYTVIIFLRPVNRIHNKVAFIFFCKIGCNFCGSNTCTTFILPQFSCMKIWTLFIVCNIFVSVNPMAIIFMCENSAYAH